jgi:acetyl-CoA carboxylase biotin carboxyl carrier protein
MDLEQIKQLMKTLEESKLKKLVVKEGSFEITLEKEGDVHYAPMPVQVAHAHHRHVSEEHSLEHAHQPPRKQEAEGSHVTSPMVGTFYASSAPDQPAFVKVGDKVTPGMVVCIVEAMKVMNEVKAGVSGTIVEILVENAQPIEFGTKLFRVT